MARSTTTTRGVSLYPSAQDKKVSALRRDSARQIYDDPVMTLLIHLQQTVHPTTQTVPSQRRCRGGAVRLNEISVQGGGRRIVRRLLPPAVLNRKRRLGKESVLRPLDVSVQELVRGLCPMYGHPVLRRPTRSLDARTVHALRGAPPEEPRY